MRLVPRNLIILSAFFFISVLPVRVLFAQQSFYDFTVLDINGEEYELAQLQGKKVLLVNTASQCALAPQFEGLERLYQKYGGAEFVILAFPSNDFGNREPGSTEEIALQCIGAYGLSFPLMARIKVKGEEKHPLYKWLTEASQNGVEESRVSWNFQKYMIDEGGTLVGHVPPRKRPECRKIISWLSKE